MTFSFLYYRIKPLIPRRLQIGLRRMIASRRRARFAGVWPIDQKTNIPPEGWAGWPEGKKFALVLTHDVDTAKGQEKSIQLAALEESLGLRSSFYFVAEGYQVSTALIGDLTKRGFEVGIHGIKHDENPFRSKKVFQKQAIKINQYLKEWGSVGFRSPCMYHKLSWIGELNIDYDASTFDTDPFEPQPDGVGTIFPIWVSADGGPTIASAVSSISKNTSVVPKPPASSLQSPTVSHMGFVELPYTLPQDFTLFILMKEKNIDIWKKKLDWIAHNRGMALLNTHPDYMNFRGKKLGMEEYPVDYYRELLEYVKHEYEGQYWLGLPKDLARFWKENYLNPKRNTSSFQSP